MTILQTINQHKQQLNSLQIPDLFEVDETIKLPYSPKIYQYHINSIKLSCLKLKLSDNLPQINDLLNEIDEKTYVINKLIEYDAKKQEIENLKVNTAEINDNDNSSKLEVTENITDLRKRLLSGGTSTSLDNDSAYHEDLQSDLLSDLSDLTSTLKSGAINLSQKILGDDLNILNETNENILRNTSLFKVIDKNLSSYINNKSGNKIGIFWLIKVVVLLIVLFLFMVLLIKIIPRIGSPV